MTLEDTVRKILAPLTEPLTAAEHGFYVLISIDALNALREALRGG